MSDWMNDFIIDGIELTVVSYLKNNKKVFIEDGMLSDEIIAYSYNDVGSTFTEIHPTFETTAYKFPKYIHLHSFNELDTEVYDGKLFINVI